MKPLGVLRGVAEDARPGRDAAPEEDEGRERTGQDRRDVTSVIHREGR